MLDLSRCPHSAEISHAELSVTIHPRMYLIKSDFAALLLSPELQAFLLEKTNVSWSAGRGAIKLFYRGGLKRKRVDQSLERIRRFRDLIDAELFTFSE